MKTATVADLRNKFRRVSAWLEEGEAVQILKRGKPYARLLPVAGTTKPRVGRVDFAAQRRAIWRKRSFSRAEVAAMRAAELEEEEG